jgi:4-hydroxy-tetrahydrodipicolinate synthase
MSHTPTELLPRGSLVALITPFDSTLAIDWSALTRLINWHVGSGTSGLVVAGTTGEASTLSLDEHGKLLAEVVSIANGRVHVMAGVGSNSTSEAVRLAQMALQAGADSLLSVVPYYNKPTQDGLYRHFTEQANATPLPLVLYSVPGRTVVDFTISTLTRLVQHANIKGIKDASGDLVCAQRLAAALPHDFIRYSGDDLTAAAVLALGGHGVISVTANIVPVAVQAQCNAIETVGLENALKIVSQLFELSEVLFTEPNPIPVKYLASRIGLCENYLREPLVPAGPVCMHAIDGLLSESALFSNLNQSY